MSDFEKVIKIVEDKQFSKIDGIGVDLFTASFIKVVYDNVNDKNKKCMEVMSIANLIGVAQTLMPKYGMSAWVFWGVFETIRNHLIGDIPSLTKSFLWGVHQHKIFIILWSNYEKNIRFKFAKGVCE